MKIGRTQSVVVVALTLAVATLGSTAWAAGPDVTVFTLSGTTNYGSAGGLRGYSIGTVSCNVGDAPLNWCDNAGGCGLGTTDEDHPVIAQNIYRLKNGRFEQIGMSWLKHGFVSTNSSASGCGDGSCDPPPLGGNQLGVGCTDPYGSSLNGSRPLGKRSEVNASTGDFPFPFGLGGSTANVYNQRAVVLESELNPATNPGARYFLEGHYIAPDDAAAGNALNNASYREVTVESGTFNLLLGAATVREKAAISAWPTIDSSVEFVSVDVPGAIVERFHVARKVTDLGGGTWHYEYAVHNMNSDRSARSFQVKFVIPATITNVGHRDVDHHSGEPYGTTNWVPTVTSDAVIWATEDFATNANANALRWGTMFNFWFDADRGPGSIQHVIGLFKPGTPTQMTFSIGSGLIFADGFESGDTSAWKQSQP